MSLKSLASNYIRNTLGISVRKPQIENVVDKEYIIVDGTLQDIDYDDAWLLALALRSKRIFDIGTNVGEAAMQMLYSNTIEDIILVDPNPKALAVASENLILNGLSHKARFICSLVTDKPDETKDFYTVGTGGAGSMYADHAKTASDVGASIKTQTTTIDTLVSRYGMIPDLMKIDTEGAEYLVLQGAKELMQKQETKMLVEMHTNTNMSMQENADNIIQLCKEVNYKAWYLKEKKELQNSEPVAHRQRCHFLLLPGEMDFPKYLLDINQGDALQKAVDSLNS